MEGEDDSFAQATAFFHACESLKGWEECSKFCTEDATFSGQCEPLVDIKTLKAYTEWMKGFGLTTVPGCKYELNSSVFDKDNGMAMFFGTFTGTHTGEGGPVEPTGKQTVSQYVYIVKMGEGKITHMTKVWNAPWALKELGWM